MARSLGVTSLQILAAIRDDAAYGLNIVATTGMPSGTVYPTLGRLRRSGLVTAHWEDDWIAEQEGRPRRRYYELTSAGVEALSRGASRMAALAAELGAEPAG
jgi:PadR family transcriptional regulator PadR